MSKKFGNGLLLWTISVAVIILFFSYQVITESDRSKKGMELVKCLYEFDTVEDLGENRRTLQELVDGDTFNRINSDNSDRALGVYLKFLAKPSKVNFIETASNYVVYSLLCDSIESNRVFILAYDVKNGKIVDVKEAELVTFSTTVGWSAR